ncbi:hypothetical protein N7517_005891 [Penicillium concentricum]|uniref:Uncharacterized protein n=1 Tax=Penicillium concentricum TaxID=293559 RepID=A0A9W9VBX7_9EURO|nr:uncharacterized protein N7517_005891 [Penicillium concentricum]KAJ5373885.1 hypothetical protein N7517_005891 [Penicillium concentricum]
MEAVIFLSSVTFVIAVGAAIIQGRYRVHLHVTSKGNTPPESLDLERFDPEGSTPLQPPPKLHRHSRLGSRNSRWPGYAEQRSQPSRTMVDSHFASYRIPEEADTGTVHHFPHSPPNLPATFMTPLARATTPQPATATSPPEAPTRLQIVHD